MILVLLKVTSLQVLSPNFAVSLHHSAQVFQVRQREQTEFDRPVLLGRYFGHSYLFRLF